MNTYKFLAIIGLLFSLSGCQKDLGVELPYEGDLLVVYGLLSADSVLSVKIDKTASPTGIFMYGEGISDATVSLFEDNVYVEHLEHTVKGIYRSPSGFKPKAGKGYSLRAEASGLPVAETSVEVIPEKVSIDSYVFEDTVTSLFVGDVARKLSFSFRDEDTEPGFYYAQMDGLYEGKPVALNTFRPDRPLEASEDICSFRSEDNQYVLSDICFNGQSFQFDIGVELGGALQDNTGTDKRRGQNVKCDKILLRFRKITKVYRDYLYRAGWETEGFFRAFTTPAQEFTNVRNGYGVWAAYSEQVIDVLQ